MRFSHLLVTLFVVVPVVVWSGCRRRSVPKTDPSGEVVSQPGPASKGPAGASEARIPTQEDIYQATRKFQERQRRPAGSVEELVAAGLLAPLPPAPPGKKYVLDQRAANLLLVDQ